MSFPPFARDGNAASIVDRLTLNCLFPSTVVAQQSHAKETSHLSTDASSFHAFARSIYQVRQFPSQAHTSLSPVTHALRRLLCCSGDGGELRHEMTLGCSDGHDLGERRKEDWESSSSL